MFTDDQVEAALDLHESGLSVPKVCHRFQVSERTFYLWRQAREARRARDAREGAGRDLAAG
jgi:transposase-like protein